MHVWRVGELRAGWGCLRGVPGGQDGAGSDAQGPPRTRRDGPWGREDQPNAAAAESEPVSPGSERTASTMATSSVPDTTTDGSIVMTV